MIQTSQDFDYGVHRRPPPASPQPKQTHQNILPRVFVRQKGFPASVV